MTRSAHQAPVTQDTIIKIEQALISLEQNMHQTDPHSYEVEQTCLTELLEKMKAEVQEEI